MTRWLRDSLPQFEKLQIVNRKKTCGMVMKQKLVEERRFEGQEAQLISGKIIRISSTWYVVNDDIFMTSIQLNLFMFFLIECNRF